MSAAAKVEPWVVPAPAPRSEWRRYRVVTTVEIEARTEDEAREVALWKRHEAAATVEAIGPAERPAPYVAHPESWRETMGQAVEPDDWHVQAARGSTWRWLTVTGLALRLPAGMADDVGEERATPEPSGPYSIVRPERSSRVTDEGEPAAQLGRAVVQRRFVWLVEQLFPGATWMAASAADPVRAFSLSGELVALVMPLDPGGL